MWEKLAEFKSITQNVVKETCGFFPKRQLVFLCCGYLCIVYHVVELAFYVVSVAL